MKAKIVIVEDNKVALRSLVETMDWASLNCELAGTAMDGEAGRELILSVQPDILLTDIRMPRKDGLQMLEEVRDRLPDMKTIVITGYDQFEYTSRAIRLSVSDYVLKPIRNEEVIRALRRTISLIQRQKEVSQELAQADQFRRKAQLLSLLTNPSHAGQDVHAMLESAGLNSAAFYLMIMQPEDSRALSLAVLSGMDDLLVRCRANALSVMLYDSLVIYAMRDNADDEWQDEAQRIAEQLNMVLPMKVHIGISSLVLSHHQIRQAYQQARQALLESTGDREEEASFCFYDESNAGRGGRANEMMRQADELVRSNDLSEACAARAAGEGKYSLLTRSVLDYVRLHCTESPKLYDVAEKFHVSVNYLSAVISRETGISFHEHVLQGKMDIAHTLLADPRILVEEVARAVGYSTYISFYNVFKRMEHMTPSEYRNKLANL